MATSDPRTATEGQWGDLIDAVKGKANSSSLATVATSGSYNDLSNKPTIPTVNDSTISLTNNGSALDSFTTNASSSKTIALEYPIINVTDTDPGEGVATTANAFTAVTGAVSPILDTFYPVGSYYETSNANFDPNTAWGGTWVEDTAGRVLVAKDTGTFSTVGGTGGAKTHSHGLSDGYAKVILKGDSRILYDEETLPMSDYWTAVYELRCNSAGTISENNQGYATRLGGNTDSASTLQPYTVVKRWHRTA